MSVWCSAAQCPLFIFHFMTKTHKTQVTCSLLTSNDRYRRRFKAPESQLCQCPSHLYPVQMSHFCAGQLKLVVSVMSGWSWPDICTAYSNLCRAQLSSLMSSSYPPIQLTIQPKSLHYTSTLISGMNSATRSSLQYLLLILDSIISSEKLSVWSELSEHGASTSTFYTQVYHTTGHP